MMQQRKALGRGLNSLIQATPISSEPSEKISKEKTLVEIEKIFPNRSQPRDHFDEESLTELSLSIKNDGLLQPIVVSEAADGRFEIIAGERRWRAAKLAGLKEVPILIRNVDEAKRLELAMVENIQRENLNAIEEARGYQSMQERFQINPADIAEKVGKSREYVANAIRLLKLPKMLQDDVEQGRLSASHARCLLALPSIEDQIQFRNRILQETLSVRVLEKMVQERQGVARKNRRKTKINLSPQIKLLLDDMEKALGTKVRLHPSTVDGRGTLLIEYYSWMDLDRVYKKLAVAKGE